MRYGGEVHSLHGHIDAIVEDERNGKRLVLVVTQDVKAVPQGERRLEALGAAKVPEGVRLLPTTRRNRALRLLVALDELHGKLVLSSARHLFEPRQVRIALDHLLDPGSDLLIRHDP